MTKKIVRKEELSVYVGDKLIIVHEVTEIVTDAQNLPEFF